jgi:hypothetical protein
MFRVVLPPINRKAYNYLQHLVFVTPLLLSAAIVEELELVWVCCGWSFTVLVDFLSSSSFQLLSSMRQNSHNIKSRQLQPKGRKNFTTTKYVFRLKVKGNHWFFYKCSFGNGILYRNKDGIVICNFHEDRPLLAMIVVRKSCIRSWTMQSMMTVSFVCRLRRASLLTVNIGTIRNRDFHSTSFATEMVRWCFNLSISIVITDSNLG